jgi:hypothetical protein
MHIEVPRAEPWGGHESGQCGPDEEIERRPGVSVVVPGDVVQQQSFGAGRDRCPSDDWITGAELSKGWNQGCFHCSGTARQGLPKSGIVASFHEKN